MNTNPYPDALRSRWTIEGRIPLSGVADGAVWHRARSIATGEDVVLFVVRGEAALEAADAVRRAYLVEDPHLLPVRDIVVFDDPRESEGTGPGAGSASSPTTVVEYPLPPAPPLAALLAKGPLHPETARAIIGEAANGLEVARRRGVRHQFLDSNRVFVDTASGAVVVLGVGVEAASHPELDRSRETASFQDAAALVALLYRALTGRSPRQGADGTVPRPSTITDTAVPEDLDLLCDLVLNESADEIPETTRGIIAALQPWQSIPVTLEAYSRTDSRADSRTDSRTDSNAESRTADADPVLESTAAMTPVPAVPAAAVAPGDATTPAGSTTGEGEDPSEDELESTALMATVPQKDEEPASEPTGSAGPAGSSAAVVGAGGVAGAAGAAGAAAVAGSGAPAEARNSEETGPDAAAASASAQTSSEAQALVQDLHLDQKRSTSPFPGHLDITAPQEPAPAEAAQPEPAPLAPAQPGSASPGAPVSSEPAAEDSSSWTGTNSAGAGAGAAIAGAAAAGTVGAVGAASSSPTSTPTTGIPSRTSGTHWPLSGAGKEAPLAPAPAANADASSANAGAAPPQASGPSPAAAAVTPDSSAPTPSQPVVHGTAADAAGPVAVGGRSAPVAPVRTEGPIVVHGRDRSLLEDQPDESTVPFDRSSLLRDVVGVAVANDAPETYTMGPRDREKRSLQSQWIIIGSALAVMIALVIALTTITSDLRDILDDPLATSPVATSAPVEEETTGEAPAEPTAEETEEALPAPELDGVELLALPAGEDPDHTDQVERLTDGDTSTYWSTQHYASPDFGGLKEGVGMRLHFAEKSTFTAVTLSTAKNNGGTVELRAVNEDGSPGDVLATGEFVADGEVRLEAPEALETQQVMLWIPDLPPDSDQNGRFRARVAEIQVE